jgi:hypothetical protein
VNLSAAELRGLHFAVALACRHMPTAPPVLLALRDRLDLEIAVAHERQSAEPRPADLNREYFGAAAAADALGLSLRTVQRRARDYGGQLVGRRWWFPVTTIREAIDDGHRSRAGGADSRTSA